MTDQASTDLREEVRARYAEAARAVLDPRPGISASCCGTSDSGSCCGTGSAALDTADAFGGPLYGEGETDGLPGEAVLASLGCGNPLAVADLHEGEQAAATNVEFLKGDIEAVPLPDAAVDVVISNCVINLSTDKPAVLAEHVRAAANWSASSTGDQGQCLRQPEYLRGHRPTRPAGGSARLGSPRKHRPACFPPPYVLVALISELRRRAVPNAEHVARRLLPETDLP